MSKPKWKYGAVTILGGTGTLGQELTKQISVNWPDIKITILSRDEHKHAAMARIYPKCNYVLGNIYDYTSITPHVKNTDVVFNVAALKHVDILERNVIQCIQTNVIGSLNSINAAQAAECAYYVFSSTDKAVDPVNAYGSAKRLAESVLYAYNLEATSRTKFSCYRWGNVLGSSGSAIPYFIQSLKETGSVNITDSRMTRFWIPIEWAVNFMLLTFPEAYRDRAMIPPTMKAATLSRVVDTIAALLGIIKYEIKYIGLRPGEKLHEAITSQWAPEYIESSTAPQYTDEELVTMLKPVIERFK